MTTRWHKKLVSYSFIGKTFFSTNYKKIRFFSFLAVLSIVLISNVFITLWIMTAIGFSSSGLPSLKVGSKHLHAQGDIFAMKSLFASRIMDYNGLIVQAFKNLSLVANSDRRHSSAMFLNENEVIVASKRFVIMNTNGDTIFSTSPEETAMTARKMRLSGIGEITEFLVFPHCWVHSSVKIKEFHFHSDFT